MTYRQFSFKDVDPNTRVVILDDFQPMHFFHKIWKLEVDRANDISEGLAANEIQYQAYLNRDNGKIVFHFNSEEDYTIAKFLV
ncbi:MAG: hypothetical protein M0R77_18910 [Gammaproteobacteria bacterium]|nr:hypothetical protein [Gammaproteobacteria bacterium]